MSSFMIRLIRKALGSRKAVPAKRKKLSVSLNVETLEAREQPAVALGMGTTVMASSAAIAHATSVSSQPVNTFGHVVTNTTPVNTFGQKVTNTTPVSTTGAKVPNTSPVNTQGQTVSSTPVVAAGAKVTNTTPVNTAGQAVPVVSFMSATTSAAAQQAIAQLLAQYGSKVTNTQPVNTNGMVVGTTPLNTLGQPVTIKITTPAPVAPPLPKGVVYPTAMNVTNVMAAAGAAGAASPLGPVDDSIKIMGASAAGVAGAKDDAKAAVGWSVADAAKAWYGSGGMSALDTTTKAIADAGKAAVAGPGGSVPYVAQSGSLGGGEPVAHPEINSIADAAKAGYFAAIAGQSGSVPYVAGPDGSIPYVAANPISGVGGRPDQWGNPMADAGSGYGLSVGPHVNNYELTVMYPALGALKMEWDAFNAVSKKIADTIAEAQQPAGWHSTPYSRYIERHNQNYPQNPW